MMSARRNSIFVYIGKEIEAYSSFCRLKPLSRYDKRRCFGKSSYLQQQIDSCNCSIAHFAGCK